MGHIYLERWKVGGLSPERIPLLAARDSPIRTGCRRDRPIFVGLFVFIFAGPQRVRTKFDHAAVGVAHCDNGASAGFNVATLIRRSFGIRAPAIDVTAIRTIQFIDLCYPFDWKSLQSGIQNSDNHLPRASQALHIYFSVGGTNAFIVPSALDRIRVLIAKKLL